MSQILEQYLDRVMIFANRKEAEACGIRAELKDHLLQKTIELEGNALSNEEAISQAIEEHGDVKTIGYGLRKRFRWIDVRTHGTARGVIAIGPKAVGVVAVGGMACGVFAYGAISVGLLSCGVLAIGLIAALGGVTLAPLGFACGLIAIGIMAAGAVSVGVWAAGGLAIGMVCESSSCWHEMSRYTWDTAPAYVQYIYVMLRQLVNILLLFWVSVIVLLIAKLILSRKEFNRIKNADPTLVQ